MTIDTFDYMCETTQKRRTKPMNNAEWLCETTERFNRFFNHLANGRFDELEKEFGFKAEVDIKKEFNDWLLLEHKEG